MKEKEVKPKPNYQQLHIMTATWEELLGKDYDKTNKEIKE